MNGLTAGAAFLASSFWDITQNNGYWIRTVASAASHAARMIGLA